MSGSGSESSDPRYRSALSFARQADVDEPRRERPSESAATRALLARVETLSAADARAFPDHCARLLEAAERAGADARAVERALRLCAAATATAPAPDFRAIARE